MMLAAAIAVPAQASGVKHVNLAAFHKTQAGYEFEAIVLGRFSDFIAEMEKGSQVIFLNHTAGIQHNDVITFNADVLREGAAGDGFDDNGVNCSISFSDESEGGNTAYSLGGLCTILMSDKGVHQKIKAIIPTADLPDTSQGLDVWVMIYEDEKTGIAFYANVTTD